MEGQANPPTDQSQEPQNSGRPNPLPGSKDAAATLASYGRGDEGAERLLEPLGVIPVQRREKPPFGVLARLAGAAASVVAGTGQLDQILAPVVGVRTALHQTLCLQRVDQGDHGGAVDRQPAGGLLLG